MRLRLTLLPIVAAALCTPSPAPAAVPLDGEYFYFAASSRRPQLHLSVIEGRGRVIGMARIPCLRAPARRLPPNRFRVRSGRFRVTISLALRLIGRGKPRDRLIVKGRWTSPRSVRGRLRLVLRSRRTGARPRYCNSGWRQWRAALDGAVSIRAEAPRTFPVPGTLTTTATVSNVGDYDSAQTLVTIAPDGSIGYEGQEPLPARPPPLVSTSQGSCRWPVSVDWGVDEWGEEYGSTDSGIECRLGKLAAKGTATITIIESWPAANCVYDEEGNASLYTLLTPAVLSPLNRPGWRIDEDTFGSDGICPGTPDPGTDPNEPAG
jgi:hypothetical protein